MIYITFPEKIGKYNIILCKNYFLWYSIFQSIVTPSEKYIKLCVAVNQCIQIRLLEY